MNMKNRTYGNTHKETDPDSSFIGIGNPIVLNAGVKVKPGDSAAAAHIVLFSRSETL